MSASLSALLSVAPSGVPLEARSGAGPWPYVIAGGILLLLITAMLILLAIGKGREHS